VLLVEVADARQEAPGLQLEAGGQGQGFHVHLFHLDDTGAVVLGQREARVAAEQVIDVGREGQLGFAQREALARGPTSPPEG
jgi:hypothetical protein